MSDKPLAGAVRAATRMFPVTEETGLREKCALLFQRESGLLELVEAINDRHISLHETWCEIWNNTPDTYPKIGCTCGGTRLQAAIEEVKS